MKERIITAIIGLAVLSLIFILGRTGIATAITIVSIIGMKELYDSFDGTDSPLSMNHKIIGLMSAIAMYLGRMILNKNINIVVFCIASFVVIAYSIFRYNSKSLSNMIVIIISIIYIPCSLWCIYDIYILKNMSMCVGYIFVIAFGSDTLAYFSGVFFGKRKIVPKISPNKTLEGFIGGAIGSVALVYLYTYIAYLVGLNFDCNLINIIVYGLFGLFGAFISQIGDLLASATKRKNGIKDFGNLMPGHGGILDRFDSILLVSPYVYIVLGYFLSWF